MIALSLVLLAFPGHSARQKTSQRMDDQRSVPEQVAHVESLLGHKAYSEISAEGRQRVRDALAVIQRTMGEKTFTRELGLHDRSVVLTQQEIVNTVMTQAHEDSRLVCNRERAVGSNLPTQVCRTVAQRRTDREDAKQELGAIRFSPPKMQGDP